MTLILNAMNQNIYHLAEIFFWMLGAFAIGLIFGRIIPKKIKDRPSNHNELFEDIGEEDFTKIRATKTFERGGKEMPQKASTENDDLQQIKGIGAVIETKLNEMGIRTFEHLSNLSADHIAQIAEKINYSEQRIEKDDWVGQARAKLKNE